ncbi:uncharacterized protein LOC119278177 [Triticum dicoccoides]|uniref:uncharacterized protein LOC119278177 n=1 Tax=Triticum dicoccoides TaxID=85692 RepID=UPI00188EA59A|nr:uncharacterized protein LOC119278177 [Triticum dicoccoides]
MFHFVCSPLSWLWFLILVYFAGLKSCSVSAYAPATCYCRSRIHAKFSLDEEYSNKNQSEDQLPKEEVPGMEEAFSHFSSDYTEYENSQPRCEVGDCIIENNRCFSYLL